MTPATRSCGSNRNSRAGLKTDLIITPESAKALNKPSPRDDRTPSSSHYGFEKPTPEIMSAWGSWFESIKDNMVDMAGPFVGGREIPKAGTRDLPLGPDSITGVTTLRADSLNEAEKMAQGNPTEHQGL